MFEPPLGALYTIDATSRIVDVPRRTILIYCKHHLLCPATSMADGYYFNGNAIQTLRRIETLRTVCGDDFAGIKIILDLTAALERLRSDLRAAITRETRRRTREGRSRNLFSFAQEI